MRSVTAREGRLSYPSRQFRLLLSRGRREHARPTRFSQNRLLIAAAGLAGAAALTGARRSLAEEAPPETTSVRLLYWPDTCLAPIEILDDPLRDEGFADVRYVAGADLDIGADRLARGDADFVQDFAATNILRIDAGVPAVMLAGVHPACFELFAHELIRSVVDLKGKTVGVTDTTAGTDYVMLKIIAASVGSIRSRTSIGSPTESAVERTFSQTARSMRSCPLRPALRNCARPGNKPSDSPTVRWIGHVAVFLLHVDRQRRFCPP